MNFVEILKSIGGVKPCSELHFKTTSVSQFGISGEAKHCELCHNTGQIFDLAPLLANPKELEECVKELVIPVAADSARLNMLTLNATPFYAEGPKPYYKPVSTLCVIGPQRAHSLVYEVARQLGGTAITCTSPNHLLENVSNYFAKMSAGELAFSQENSFKRLLLEESKARLSLPIPPDATVLFVTDKLDEEEILTIIKATPESSSILPYILCLVGGKDHAHLGNKIGIGSTMNKMQVISLHQEK